MCGRFYVDKDTYGDIQRIIRGVSEKDKTMFRDVLPSMRAIVLTGKKPKLSAEEMEWGFRSANHGGLLINARAETVRERPSFRDSVLHRRCVIPAKRFYEWDSAKTKVTFSRPAKGTFFFAGCYQLSGGLSRFVIITTGANASMRPVHDRMPLILEESELEPWIYDEAFTDDVLRKIPCPLERCQEYEQQRLPFC